ncbi:hypothetical protein [Sciscionella sediminilitoris]|uniref:hypothetical protein n=1 Tax=Sciscionella sediminilitoris TaxID=1445613 RepID=UPI0004DF0983|nr:hypothetical protein [Sciscionella sp. SE31]
MTTATDTTTAASTAPVLFRTDRATLARALTTVGVGMARRPAVPMLGGVLQYARGVRLVARPPHQLAREDWNRAALVLIDAQAAPVLRARPHELPPREAVMLLADPEDQDEPDLYRHALALGATHLVTVPDDPGVLRKQKSMLVERPALVVAVLDPDPSGEVGTASTASLALAGTAAGEHLGLINARPTRLDLHRAIQRAARSARHRVGQPAHAVRHRFTAAPEDAVREAMTDLACRHAVTLLHLDPHQADTVATLGGVDLIIVPFRAHSVTAPATWSVVPPRAAPPRTSTCTSPGIPPTPTWSPRSPPASEPVTRA